MKKLVTLFCIGLLAVQAFANPQLAGTDKGIADILRQAATARDIYQDEKALALYKQVLTKDSTNLYALYNCGMIIQRKGWLAEETNVTDAVKYYKEAKVYAEKTYKYYPTTFEANLSMAGTIGRLLKFGTTKERVNGAWDIKKYADAAAKINANDPQLLHLLAWWNFELSKPTWFERSMADMIYGGLPKGANINTAINYMLALIKYNPNYVVYGYDLALFYKHLGEKTKAIDCLKRVILLTPHAPEEFPYQKSAQRLLNQLQ